MSKFSLTSFDIRSKFNKVKNAVLQVSAIEALAREVTSNQPWGSKRSEKLQIAEATHNYEDFKIIMSVIWKRINDNGKNHRCILKGLQLLEYLIYNGSDRVVEEARDAAYTIRTLKTFYYRDEKGKEQGKAIRELAKKIVDVIGNKKLLKKMRKEARKQRDKYAGISKSDARFMKSNKKYSDSDDSNDEKNSEDEDPKPKEIKKKTVKKSIENDVVSGEDNDNDDDDDDEDFGFKKSKPDKEVPKKEVKEKDSLGDLSDFFGGGDEDKKGSSKDTSFDKDPFQTDPFNDNSGDGDDFDVRGLTKQTTKKESKKDNIFDSDPFATDPFTPSPVSSSNGSKKNNNNSGGGGSSDITFEFESTTTKKEPKKVEPKKVEKKEEKDKDDLFEFTKDLVDFDSLENSETPTSNSTMNGGGSGNIINSHFNNLRNNQSNMDQFGNQMNFNQRNNNNQNQRYNNNNQFGNRNNNNVNSNNKNNNNDLFSW